MTDAPEAFEAACRANEEEGGAPGLAFGITDIVRGEIALNPRASESVLRLAALHEVLHAALMTTGGVPITGEASRDELEEAAVTALAAPVLAVLRDNPEFTRWLLAAPGSGEAARGPQGARSIAEMDPALARTIEGLRQDQGAVLPDPPSSDPKIGPPIRPLTDAELQEKWGTKDLETIASLEAARALVG